MLSLGAGGDAGDVIELEELRVTNVTGESIMADELSSLSLTVTLCWDSLGQLPGQIKTDTL